MVRGVSGNVPAAVLLGLGAFAEADMGGRESHHDLEGIEHEHDDFGSFVIAVAPQPSLDALRTRVAAALAVRGVLRVKGRAQVDGKTALAVVQGVGPRVDVSFAPGAGEAGLVVIGLRDMDRAAVTVALG
jgi:cobalamin biosynthesis protein CobW